ncbi:DUF3927 family protein [Salmonella enterica]|nr:DUF3927 domain-containing protein [Salmonella enterica]MCV5337888.1 DUF3927 family protein [Escherichia coli]MCH5828649.1 DUF3927 family protein [Salmonella enterica]MCH5856742.1 DUF3927 family protein [Salmonella enterica]MCH5893836.1 DUF3927 family protein [Salmonella enterica]
MASKARIAIAIGFLLLSVLVDFTSTILSVLSDGALVAVAVTLVWPIFKTASKEQ